MKNHLNPQNMKTTLLFAGTFTFLNVQLKIMPSMDLLVVMGISIFVDLITGVLKAVLLHQARTSEGYRKTVVKFLQYGGSVIVGVGLKYIASKNEELAQIGPVVSYLTNGLVAFIIFIECTSVLENLYAVDQTTPFSRYIIKPLLSLLTFQLKTNPIAKADEGLQKQESEKTSSNEANQS